MIGSSIGTYRMAELLGDGGLGPVFRGVDQATGREAAFRLFSQDVSRDPMLAERLRAMSPVLKRLQHANLGAVYDLIAVGADLAMFLEYVPGSSLDHVRRETGQIDVNVAVSCAVQVLRALEFAHGFGVLHHALRPTNILVTPQGTVKVMDFGIGHAFGANRKTREDRLLGVLAYLAPEQIQNQPGDARSDIYAVGVVLYELLTGRLPFDHRTEFALRQSHLHEPPAPPRAYVPELPEWLDRAVMRALAKSPGARFQNATECRAVLEAALGLSTSKAAAVVRDVGGATVAMFEAAPPIPPAAALPVDAQGGYVVPPSTAAPAPTPPEVVPPPAMPPPEAAGTVVMTTHEAPPPVQAPSPPPAAAQSAAPALADEPLVVRPVKASDLPTSPLAAPDLDALVPPALGGPPRADAPVEKTMAAAPPPSTPLPKPAARPAPVPGGRRSKTVLLVAAVGALAIAGASVGAFLWMRGQAPAPAAEELALTPPAVQDATPEPLAAPVPSADAQATGDAAPPPPGGAIPPPLDAAPPATAPPPAPPPSQPARRATAKPKPKPEDVAPSAPVVTPPPAPVAEPPAATPPPPPAPKAPAFVVNLPDVSFRKVKLITQEGATETSTDVVLMFLGDRLAVTPNSGGTTIRNLRYGEVSGLTYAKDEKKRFGLIKTTQHMLTVDTKTAPMVLRLDSDNVEAILSALEARTGKSVSR